MMNNNRLLIVDDDPAVRAAYGKIFQESFRRDMLREGEALFHLGNAVHFNARALGISPAYDLTVVESGKEAVDVFRQSVEAETPMAVVFVDMLMPGMDGAETARQIWDMDARAKIAMVTAYSKHTPEELVRIVGREDLFYLQKPFNPGEIRQLARCLTSQWNLEREKELFEEEIQTVSQNLEALVEEKTRDLRERGQQLNITLRQLRKALGATIEALAAAAEARDPYTAGHQRRVAHLARTIAADISLSKEMIEGIRLAGSIHDIGKIRVPSEILNRPGKINTLEMQLIRMHPEVGYEIIKNIQFPWPVAQIELQHHERLDGSGYPQGLKGDQILMEARVIAVADVVEAMSSHRPYRPALGLEKAFLEIEEGRGTLYEPGVVDSCIRLFQEKGFDWERGEGSDSNGEA